MRRRSEYPRSSRSLIPLMMARSRPADTRTGGTFTIPMRDRRMAMRRTLDQFQPRAAPIIRRTFQRITGMSVRRGILQRKSEGKPYAAKQRECGQCWHRKNESWPNSVTNSIGLKEQNGGTKFGSRSLGNNDDVFVFLDTNWEDINDIKSLVFSRNGMRYRRKLKGSMGKDVLYADQYLSSL